MKGAMILLDVFLILRECKGKKVKPYISCIFLYVARADICWCLLHRIKNKLDTQSFQVAESIQHI